jgi:hypothetical protein
MTPEQAHEIGKRTARIFVAPGETPDVDEVEDFIALDVDEVTPLHLRGAAEYFRELACEIDARAAALEATR